MVVVRIQILSVKSSFLKVIQQAFGLLNFPLRAHAAFVNYLISFVFKVTIKIVMITCELASVN